MQNTMAASEINEKRRFRKEKMKRGKGKEKGENFIKNMVKGPSFLECTLGKK